MLRSWLLTALLAVGLAGPVWAQEEPVLPDVQNQLPRGEVIAWDAQVFERDVDSFNFVKRTWETAKGQLTWLVEVNTPEAATRINDNGKYTAYGYFAEFHDDEGVVIKKVKIATYPAEAVHKGDRVRAVLKLPAEEVILASTKVRLRYFDD